jgi:hypothetical protein
LGIRRVGIYLELVAQYPAGAVETLALDAVAICIRASACAALPNHDEVACEVSSDLRDALTSRCMGIHLEFPA